MQQVRRNIKNSIKSHFAKLGVRFETTVDSMLRQLEKLMGPDRFEEWYETSIRRQSGLLDASEEYVLYSSASEVNLVFSLQSNVMLESAAWLDSKVAESAHDAERICDLGCGSGVLTSWIASQHTGCDVIGVDAVESLLDCARESVSLPNLSFQHWDYRKPKPKGLPQSDVLVSSLGIDFAPLKEHDSIETTKLRAGPKYTAAKEEAKAFLLRWREAIKDDGYLFAVLRLSFESHFMAFVDAAHQTGWSFVRSKSTCLMAEDERFPAMTFQARPSPALSEEELLSFWAAADLADGFAKPLKDTVAIIVFNALGNKHILKSDSRTFDDGHTMVTSIGTSGALGFCFSRATTGFARLEIVPITQVGTLAIRFRWDDNEIDAVANTRDRGKSKTRPKRNKRRRG